MQRVRVPLRVWDEAVGRTAHGAHRSSRESDEALIKSQEGLSDLLSEFARTMVTNSPTQAILDRLVTRVVDVLPITGAGVTLMAPGLQPQYVAASDPSARRYEELQTELGEGPCLEAFSTGVAISVSDLRDEQRFPAFSPRAIQSGLAAVFTFPLRHGDVRLGALDLYRGTPGPLSPDSMVDAQTLADVAAVYLINAQARSDLEHSSDQSREAALHDPLTGLPNRVLILELIERAFRAASRSETISALFFVDLDHFKEVNDTYGHQIGDELLVEVGKRLTALLRPGDSIARLSGDEFVILCEELTDPAAADPIAVRLDSEMSRTFALSRADVQTTASIGIAFTGNGIGSAEELLRDADLAMYRSKRDRAESHDVPDLRRVHHGGHQAGLDGGLPGAISRGELHLAYQPIVAAQTGRPVAVEALLRWTHPARGPVAPAVFIPRAEQSGQILELGEWVLERACADRNRWQRHSPTEIAISINVSAHQLVSAGFTATVAAVLARTSTDPSLLMLEITEGVIVHDEKRALSVLTELKEIGITFALDDFGTGYSSLGYLTSFPIDTIKIDQSFIASLDAGPGGEKVVNAIIGLAHSLGMTVVSEGIETATQRQTVTDLGADCCQGFYFARPMPAAGAAALFQDAHALPPLDVGCLHERVRPHAVGEGRDSTPRTQVSV
jgi:diguanylate cyclase (GGDEF)-like protein